MKSAHGMRRVTRILATLFAIFTAALASAAPTTGIVVFGDSLSDSGNLFALSGVNNWPPQYSDASLIPDDAYTRGGHHLTNGATWIEQAARGVGLTPNVAPAYRGGNPRATNYAVAGARAYDRPGSSSINLGDQVRDFLADFGTAPANALYVIEFGGNDIRDALVDPDPAAIIAAAVGGVRDAITTLYAAGARQFLVWNAPDLGLTPAVRGAGPSAAAAATALTQAYNANLSMLLAGLRTQFPGIDIQMYDLYAKVAAIHADPSAFGLANVTDACVQPGDPPFACRRPDGYFFWDGIHPTRAVHGIIGTDISAMLRR